ncbi:hypothetical protein [Celeribacter arenosi]|uniref:Uncharacterized protein n=1 Tax=Celeribacter arenosi TaxID=792649 RepID=A0ABP7KIX9_9RHOB
MAKIIAWMRHHPEGGAFWGALSLMGFQALYYIWPGEWSLRLVSASVLISGVIGLALFGAEGLSADLDPKRDRYLHFQSLMRFVLPIAFFFMLDGTTLEGGEPWAELGIMVVVLGGGYYLLRLDQRWDFAGIWHRETLRDRGGLLWGLWQVWPVICLGLVIGLGLAGFKVQIVALIGALFMVFEPRYRHRIHQPRWFPMTRLALIAVLSVGGVILCYPPEMWGNIIPNF